MVDCDVIFVLAMSATVSDATQKKSGELTQPIGRTSSMQRRTSDVLILHR